MLDDKFLYTYDAWNRLITVFDRDNLVASGFDAVGHISFPTASGHTLGHKLHIPPLPADCGPTHAGHLGTK